MDVARFSSSRDGVSIFLCLPFLEPQVCCGIQRQAPGGYEWNHLSHVRGCPSTHGTQQASNYGEKSRAYTFTAFSGG